MVLLTPRRIHFYEINDQSWFPPYLRSKVQSCLTLLWTLTIPPIQPTSPASLVARTLQRALGPAITSYTYVDFAAGAGGPTPYIERDLNARLRARNPPLQTNGHAQANGIAKPTNSGQGVDFVLTDIHPHLEAWETAAAKSENLRFIARSVDAGDAPRDLGQGEGKKVFRLFNLAFHHFDDELAARILKNTLHTSEGFGIFELQGRTVASLFTISMMWPLLLLITPFYYWRSPGHLFFTYLVPVIPFVLVFDGYVSSLRTRSPGELLGLMEGVEGREGWRFRSGKEIHTWPTGEMTWFIGVREG